jgi:hypothetical protein
MKNTILLVALVFASTFAIAQGRLTKGQNQLNAGFGFSGWGLPVYVGFDHGVGKDITVGAELSFRAYRESFRQVNYSHTIFGFSANGNYHFNNLLDIDEEWDVYAGLNIGFYAWSSPNNYPGNYASSPGLSAQVGGRYFFNSRTGLNLEFLGGNVLSGGKFGITHRF